MTPISVLIPDDCQDFSLRVAACLSQVPGVDLHIMCRNKYTSTRFSRFCSSFHWSQYDDNEQHRLEEIADVVKQAGIQVILPASLEGVDFASRWQEELRQLTAVAFVPPRDTFTAMINKELFAKTLKNHGIPHPETIPVASGEQFEQQLADFTFPALIKPTFGAGGLGIQVFHTRQELLDFINSHPEVDGTYLLQRFIPGRDFGCSVLSDRGKILAYTLQTSTATRTGFTPFQEVQIIHNEAMLELVTRLFAALEWSGVAHIDLRYNDLTQQVEVIEVNPRYWGSLLASLVAGVNFPYLACFAALGHQFAIPEYSDVLYSVEPDTVRRLVKVFLGGKWHSFKLQRSSLGFMLQDPLAYLVQAFEGPTYINSKPSLSKALT